MTREEKVARLKEMIKKLADEAEPKELAEEGVEQGGSGLEAMSFAAAGSSGHAFGDLEDAKAGVDKLLADDDDVSDAEIDGLEAIVLKQGRPVVFIRNNGRYDALPSPWTKFNTETVRNRLQPLFGSIGRVDLPNTVQIPYGGTAMIVGPGLLMTNRHVAALFTSGLGLRGLVYTAGNAAINFKHEVDMPRDDRSAFLEVKKVVMVHPYWDMALLRVEGLPANRPPLRLSTTPPQDLLDQDVIVVGYPARDSRNDLTVQERIFGGVYDVKRMQPGKLRKRDKIRSFETTVLAVTHDSSTLGGNSGSAILNAATGEVVGLHFAGLYLKANYAVPTFELARDPRVVDLGLNFTGRVPPTKDFDAAWARVGRESPQPDSSDSDSGPTQTPSGSGHPSVSVAAGVATWMIPIQVAVTLGTPTLAQPQVSVVAPSAAPPVAPPPADSMAADAAVEARMQKPVIHPDLESRTGYQPDFLGLDGGEVVPLPDLTAAGKRVVAKLDDGSPELKYHRFSVVMHKKRRLALFTAANVDWQPSSRTVNGVKPSRAKLNGLPEGVQELWSTDPRIPEHHQLPDVFFTKDKGSFDRGHIVRRDDVCWGASFKDMQKGNGDTFHTTNCSPQVAKFNQSSKGSDNWGDLENLIQQETKAETVCVIAGPVLDDGDRSFDGQDSRGPVSIKIPQQYWKIVVANGDDGPQAFGFVLQQDLSKVPLEVPLEFAVPQPWKRFMKSIEDIEAMLNGWVKLGWYKDHDAMDTQEGKRIATAVKASGQG